MLKRKIILLMSAIIAIALGLNAAEPIKTLKEKSEKEKFRNQIKEAKIKKITAVKYEIVDKKETGKKFVIIEQEFDINGNLVMLKTYDKEEVVKTIKFYYDQDFNLVTEEEYSKDNKLYKKTVYKYQDGRIKNYEVSNDAGKILESTQYEYSQDKKMITVKKFKEGKYLEYYLDCLYKENYDKEKETEIFMYRDDGKLQTRTENQYDEKGNLLDKITYDSNNIAQSYINYKYDKNGNNIKITLFNKDREIQYYDEFKYNEKNICVEIKRFYTPERMLTKIVHELEYFK